MIHLAGMAALAGAYQGFIIDLWGVLHDGVRPYPGAVECLTRLRAGGARVVLLTNAPRRSEPIRRQLAEMGIGPDLYDDALSSGEATYRMLRDRPDGWWRGLGRRLYHLGPERDLSVFEGLDVEILPRPQGASGVVNTGPDDRRAPTDPTIYDAELAECAARALPMVCANPDLAVVRGGVQVLCAGTFARRYEALGGEVRSLGKPDPLIYGPVLERLGLPLARILAVGDSLRTDMAGAQAIGVDGCWVLGGLHGDHAHEGHAALAAEAAALGLSPRATVPHFVW